MQKTVSQQAASSSNQRDQYLAEWQKAQEKMVNPELKAAAEARRAELLPAIEEIKASLGSARSNFDPMMQNLKDLQLFLGADLNTSGLATAQNLITKCNELATNVKNDIDKGNLGLRNLAARITPGGAPAGGK
jgi:hypothetical protein